MFTQQKLALLVAIMLIAIFCAKSDNETPKPKDAVELVPLDNEISGWSRSSAMRIAENETQLYDLIDGEAPIYTTRGFKKCAFQDYTDTTAIIELKLRIFDQTDTTNAKSVYDYLEQPGSIPWTGDNAGVEARYVMVGFSYTLDFWDDRFYVNINISDNTQAGLDVAKLFALNISAAIRDTTQ